MGFKEELKTKSLFSNLSFFIPCSTRLKPAYSMGGWTVTYGISRGLSAHNTMHIIHYSTVKHGSTAWAPPHPPQHQFLRLWCFLFWQILVLLLATLLLGSVSKFAFWVFLFFALYRHDRTWEKWNKKHPVVLCLLLVKISHLITLKRRLANHDCVCRLLYCPQEAKHMFRFRSLIT